MIGRCCQTTPALLSLRVLVLHHENTRTFATLLGPCFKTGGLQPFRLRHNISSKCLCRTPNGDTQAFSGRPASGRLIQPATHEDPTTKQMNERLAPPALCMAEKHWAQTLSLQRFQVLFTLFSKFFSSFLHSTCSLSVSRQYLALDGIYHPLGAAVPSNTTRRRQTVRSRQCKFPTGLSPFVVPYPKRLELAVRAGRASPCYNSERKPGFST